jgi:hypothetical protein
MMGRLVHLVMSVNDGSFLGSLSEAPFLWVWLWFSGNLCLALSLVNMLVGILSIEVSRVELKIL